MCSCPCIMYARVFAKNKNVSVRTQIYAPTHIREVRKRFAGI